MLRKKTLVAVLALMTTLSAPSLFADPRHDDRTRYDRAYGRNVRLVTLEGRIRDIDRDRNGVVIRLDRGSYRVFAPASSAVRRLGRGDVIRVRGPLRSRNLVYVQSLQVLRDADRTRRDYRTVTGTVQSYDRWRDVLYLRDYRGRVVAVQVGDQADLRRIDVGEQVTARGQWSGSHFVAYHVYPEPRRW